MKESILVSDLAAPGVRIAVRPEAPELSGLLTFGDVPAEYAAANDSCVVFDATDRGALSIEGADAVDFLHRILSNEVREIEPGRGNRNLLLTPKGKVRFDFDLERDEDTVRLSVPPGTDVELAAAIDQYLFAEDVRVENATAGHAPLELCGPESKRVLQQLLGSAPAWIERVHSVSSWNGVPVRLSALGVAGSPGWRLDAGPEHARALWDAALAGGARPAGIVVRDILRVEAGAALFGMDVDEAVYPQEARLEPAFGLEKGCYIGQEVVAKIDTYGGLNKRLVTLRIDHDDPVERGTRLLRDEGGEERDLGVVTSWAYSFVLDTGAVLAFVKRRHQALGTVFRLSDGSGTATVVATPVRQGALAVTGEFE